MDTPRLVGGTSLQPVRKFLYICIVASFLFSCNSGPKTNLDEIHKIDLENEAAFALVRKDQDSCLKILKNTIQESAEINYEVGQARALSIYGIILTDRRQNDSAILIHRQALKLRQDANDQVGVAKSLSNIAEIYEYSGDNKMSIQIADSARRLYVEADSLQYLAGIYGNIAINYILQEENDSAKKYFLNAVVAANKYPVTPYALMNAYKNYGLFSLDNISIDTAEFYVRKALKVAIDNELETQLAGLYLSLGSILRKKDPLETSRLYDTALQLGNQQNWPGLKTKILLSKLRYEKGLSSSEIIALYDSLRVADKETYSLKRLKNFADFEVKYKTAETEARNRELKAAGELKTKTQIALLIFLLLSIAVIVFVLRNLRLTKRVAASEKELAEQQIEQLIKTQEVQKIDDMLEVQEKERKRIASDLHDRLGSLLGALKLNFGSLSHKHKEVLNTTPEPFEAVKKLINESTSEVRRISHDMSSGTLTKFGLLQAIYDLKTTLKSSGKLHIEFHENGLENRLSSFQEITLYRILQELVSNTIKHAKAKTIEIHLTKSGNHLMMLVEDDGVGFDISKVKQGLGLRNMENRAKSIGATLTIDSNEKSGTTASIELEIDDE